MSEHPIHEEIEDKIHKALEYDPEKPTIIILPKFLLEPFDKERLAMENFNRKVWRMMPITDQRYKFDMACDVLNIDNPRVFKYRGMMYVVSNAAHAIGVF